MNHIDLFAGCGGMSLGLKYSGFRLLLANELSPMAAETFSYNLLKQDLEKSPEKAHVHQQVLWINSNHNDFSKRLRENPLEYPDIDNIISSDIPEDPNELLGKLLVGNITHLNHLLNSNNQLLKTLKEGFYGEGVDLVSGGPPCQSFSLAGLRKKDCEKNTLPWEFANFVEKVESKFVIFENVTGILRAFKQDGESFHAWFEVAKVFASKGYVPLCLHINARMLGVPQNRPRFIMLAIRSDIYESLKPFNETEAKLFSSGESLLSDVKAGKKVCLTDFSYFDAHRDKDLALLRNSFLKPLFGAKEVSVEEAIGDLEKSSTKSKSNYVEMLNSTLGSKLHEHSYIANHDYRNNGDRVKRRFRLYQIIQQVSKNTASEILNILKQKTVEMSEEAWQELSLFEYLTLDNELARIDSKNKLINLIKLHPTQKHSQKALNRKHPASAALSIPDDACHYSMKELRTLTVREMARIQSFPDNFVFKSKATTGGKMRSYEVPQYTQVGNAVPPMLAAALGNVVKYLNQRSTAGKESTKYALSELEYRKKVQDIV